MINTRQPREMAIMSVIDFKYINGYDTYKIKQPQAEKSQEEKPHVLWPDQFVAINQAKSASDDCTTHSAAISQAYEGSSKLGNRIDPLQRPEQGISNEVVTKTLDDTRFVHFQDNAFIQDKGSIEEKATISDTKIAAVRSYFSIYADAQFFPNLKACLSWPCQNFVSRPPTGKKEKCDYAFYIDKDLKGHKGIILNDDFIPFEGMGLAQMVEERSHASLISYFIKTDTIPVYSAKGPTVNRPIGVLS